MAWLAQGGALLCSASLEEGVLSTEALKTEAVSLSPLIAHRSPAQCSDQRSITQTHGQNRMRAVMAHL